MTNQPSTEDKKSDNTKPVSKYKIPPKRPSQEAKENPHNTLPKPEDKEKDKVDKKREEDIFGSELKDPSSSVLDNMFNEIKTDQLPKTQQINGNEDADVNELFEDKEEEDYPEEKENINYHNNADLLFEITENINTYQTNNDNQQLELENDKCKTKGRDENKDHDHINLNNEHYNEHEQYHEHVEAHSSPQTTESKEITSEAENKLKEDNKEANGNGNEFEEKNKEDDKEKQIDINFNKDNVQENIEKEITQLRQKDYTQIPTNTISAKTNQYFHIENLDETLESNKLYATMKIEMNELKTTINALKAQNKSLKNEVALFRNENKEQQGVINQLKRRELIEGENVLKKQIEMLMNEVNTKEKINKLLMEENNRLDNTIKTFNAIANNISSKSKENDNIALLPIPPYQIDINDINSSEQQFNQQIYIDTNTKDQIKELKDKERDQENGEEKSNEKDKDSSNKHIDNTMLASQKIISEQPHMIQQPINELETKQLSKEKNNEETYSHSLINTKEANLEMSNANVYVNKTDNLFDDLNPAGNNIFTDNTKNKKDSIDIFSQSDINESKEKEKKSNIIMKPLSKPMKPVIKQNINSKTNQIPQTQFNFNEEEEVDSIFKSSDHQSDNKIFD